MSKICSPRPPKKNWARGRRLFLTSFFVKGSSEYNRKNTVNTSVFGNKSPVFKRTHRHTNRKFNKSFSTFANCKIHQKFTFFQTAPKSQKMKSNKKEKMMSPCGQFLSPVFYTVSLNS